MSYGDSGVYYFSPISIVSANNIIHNINRFINCTRQCPGDITEKNTEEVFSLKERNRGTDNEQVNREGKYYPRDWCNEGGTMIIH